MKATTLNEALGLLDYFNGFHDGFIKRLSILSRDEFASRGEQHCWGELVLEVTFAHYNYQDGKRPHDQLVEARFELELAPRLPHLRQAFQKLSPADLATVWSLWGVTPIGAGVTIN